MTQEALKLALEALELLTGAWQTCDALDYGDNAIAAIKEALAQPEQEPVAWFSPSGNLYKTRLHATANGEQVVTPLYTTPPQRKPLTDDEIWDAYMESPLELNCTTDDLYAFSRIIENKVKEKNT